MNNVIDALAQSPPSAEVTEAAGKGYVLIPLGLGEVPELTNYPYEVLDGAAGLGGTKSQFGDRGGSGDLSRRRAISHQP